MWHAIDLHAVPARLCAGPALVAPTAARLHMPSLLLQSGLNYRRNGPAPWGTWILAMRAPTTERLRSSVFP